MNSFPFAILAKFGKFNQQRPGRVLYPDLLQQIKQDICFLTRAEMRDPVMFGTNAKNTEISASCVIKPLRKDKRVKGWR